MKLKELKQQISSQLAGGMKKSEVFEQVCQQGAKPRAAAKLIASYADPARCAAHRGKVKVLVGIMCFLVMICFISGYFTGMDKGQGGSWIFAILMAIIPAAFAQGFYRNSASAYNIYLILTIIQLPRAFEGFTQTPVLGQHYWPEYGPALLCVLSAPATLSRFCLDHPEKGGWTLCI